MINAFARDTNDDPKCRLTAIPCVDSVIFRWRDPVMAANKMKTGYDSTEMFYIIATFGPKDTFWIKVREADERKRTLREMIYIFLWGEIYVNGLFREFGYRYRLPQTKQDTKSRRRRCKSMV